MTIELQKEARVAAIASLRRYFEEEFPEPLGELPAGLLLNFFLEEVGPVIYNRAIADASERMQARANDLPSELFADEYGYWPRVDARRKARR